MTAPVVWHADRRPLGSIEIAFCGDLLEAAYRRGAARPPGQLWERVAER